MENKTVTSPNPVELTTQNKTETTSVNPYQDALTKTNKEIKLLKKEVKEVKRNSIKIIEILGIFVALFTFVSVDIQILRNISSLNNAVFFVLLMFFCLIGFVFFLHIVLNNQFKIINFLILIGLLFAIMIFFIVMEKNGKSIPLENTNTINELDKRIYGLEQRMNGFGEIKNIKVSY